MARLKAELSEKNEYWISKHRYYELRHFCLQYEDWKTAYNAVSLIAAQNTSGVSVDHGPDDPVAKAAAARIFYKNRMELIERLTKEADPALYAYIFKGVTEGLSYDVIRARMDIPCCRDTYYDVYRRFFWLLDKARE